MTRRIRRALLGCAIVAVAALLWGRDPYGRGIVVGFAFGWAARGVLE